MREFSRRLVLISLYAVFLISIGFWLKYQWAYRNVEDWQAVPIERFTDTETGIDYGYQVGGSTYNSRRISPDGGELFFQRDVAYHHPGNPALAVLVPLSYRGWGLLLVAVMFGIPVLVHFFSLFRRKTEPESLS
ncbi:MAG: hypothetical protein HKN23_15535 [Verrucomicrobiales bacterium]|nr:hypothetical protein [Verrucomicrobiales bacterium]